MASTADEAESSRPAQRCRDCGQGVRFVWETFGSLCPACGAVQDEDDRLVLGAGPSTYDRRTVRSSTEARPTATQRRVSSFHQSRSDEAQENLRVRLSSKESQTLLRKILRWAKCEARSMEVEALLLRVDALARALQAQPDRVLAIDNNDGPEEDQRLIAHAKPVTQLDEHGVFLSSLCAACLLVIRRAGAHATIEGLSAASGLELERIRRALGNIETILGSQRHLWGTNDPLLRRTVYDPSAFIDAQIRFLKLQCRLPPTARHDTSLLDCQPTGSTVSLFDKDEQALLLRAGIGSDAFRTMAMGIAHLCASRGLSNVVARRHGSPLDLGLAAWAIVLLTIDVQVGECLAGRAFVEACAWAPGWRTGNKLPHYTKTALGLTVYYADSGWYEEETDEVGDESEEDVMSENASEGGTPTKDEVRRQCITTIADLVNVKLNSICRLLSLYARNLPWFCEGTLRGVKRQRTARAASSKGDSDASSLTKAVSRSLLVRYIKDVLQLRPSLEPRVDRQMQRDKGVSLDTPVPWHRLWYRDVHKTRQALDRDRKQANEASADQAWASVDPFIDAPSLHTADHLALFHLHMAVRALPLAQSDHTASASDQRTALARSIGPRLLTEDALRDMDDAAVDRVLFRHDEMDAYMRL